VSALSRSRRDYLKALYLLATEGGWVREVREAEGIMELESGLRSRRKQP
jgi:hypothetical protein